MADFPVSLGGRVLSDSISASPTSNASTHTKGTYSTLVASSSADATALIFGVHNASGTGRGFLVDIAVGAASSEQIILADLLVDQPQRHTVSLELPCLLPAGSRLSARVQSSTGSSSVTIDGVLIDGGLWGQSVGAPVLTLNADTSTTKGVTLDAGAASSTYGAWSTISASTAADIIAINVRKGTNRNTAPVDANLNQSYLQIGVGAAASEQVIARIPISTTTTGYMGVGFEHWLPVNIPAGSRVAARMLCVTTDATDRLLGVQILALQA